MLPLIQDSYRNVQDKVNCVYIFVLFKAQTSGSLVVVYGLSSSSDYPGIQVTEQAGTGSVGSLQSPISLQKGSGPVILTYGCSGGVCRYGDYFGAGLDLEQLAEAYYQNVAARANDKYSYKMLQAMAILDY